MVLGFFVIVLCTFAGLMFTRMYALKSFVSVLSPNLTRHIHLPSKQYVPVLLPLSFAVHLSTISGFYQSSRVQRIVPSQVQR